MTRRIVTLLIAAPLAVAFFVCPRFSSTANDSFQQRRQRPRPVTPAPAGSNIDYSKFSHRSAAHKEQACSACHKTPTENWRKAGDFPDVADYPDHISCVRCHRQQFFNGARPAICTVCHTRVSPRDDARFAFAKPSVPTQFNTEFPHDKHQDVIAKTLRPSDSQDKLRFVRASFQVVQQKDEKKYNNCSICHLTSEKKLPASNWPDSFVPAVSSFKTAPSGHLSCFNCHWKSQQPVAENCAGCHKLSATNIQSELPKRISIKFTHAREEHVAECTTCHINITKAATLRGLKPDVPITSCSTCHKTSTDKKTVTIAIEIEERRKNTGFVCAKCHTSDVGRKSAPASHYSIFND
ncbi:MAG: cytochrome c3 family protein [Pyrinomonadaceae bacterium]